MSILLSTLKYILKYKCFPQVYETNSFVRNFSFLNCLLNQNKKNLILAHFSLSWGERNAPYVLLALMLLCMLVQIKLYYRKVLSVSNGNKVKIFRIERKSLFLFFRNLIPQLWSHNEWTIDLDLTTNIPDLCCQLFGMWFSTYWSRPCDKYSGFVVSFSECDSLPATDFSAMSFV